MTLNLLLIVVIIWCLWTTEMCPVLGNGQMKILSLRLATLKTRDNLLRFERTGVME